MASHHPLAGVVEKLRRADENIADLKREIDSFLQDGKYAIAGDEDVAAVEETSRIHASRAVPLRFSVLSGEIVHHLRSSLDHIAWQLSSPERRRTHPTSIEFPIFARKPMDKRAVREYERKVQGISDVGRNLIESLQPYHCPPTIMNGPRAHPLWIIHDMDRVDKHRELVITLAAFDIRSDGPTQAWGMFYRQADFPEWEIAGLSKSLDPNSEITPQVSFRNFGGWEIKPVIPGLKRLSASVHQVLVVFEEDCF